MHEGTGASIQQFRTKFSASVVVKQACTLFRSTLNGCPMDTHRPHWGLATVGAERVLPARSTPIAKRL